MRLTAEIDCHATREKRGARCFGPRMTNFLSAIQQFAAVGDIMIGGSQNLIACGVWSLVRMSLLSIVNFTSHLEKLSSLLMNAGRSAPRYQSIASLYPQSEKLQSHLSEYFIVAVDLCHMLFKYTQKSTLGQFTSSLTDSELKTFQSGLDLWAYSIKEEANLLESQENTGFRALWRTGLKSTSHEQKIRTRLQVLDFCSKYDYETPWKQSRKVGNANLFKGTDEYKNWKCQAKSCSLLCIGHLGSGKSVLLANVVDDLNLFIPNRDIPVAYFFCRYDIPESLNAETIIISLVRQLLSPILDLTKVAKHLDDSTSTPDVNFLYDLLRDALPPTSKAYFILDGLDECTDQERNNLILELRKLQDEFTILLCVSFRPDPNDTLKVNLERFNVPSYISIPQNNPDIQDFIENELANCLESRRLVIGNPVMILEIRDALIRGSQGMFLWVALQIISLCAMKTDDAIRQALLDLPKDLPETFARILARSEEVGEPYQRLILELVTVVQRPLKAEELREALSVVPGNATWNRGALLNDVYSTLACCGSLVIVDEEELTVRFVHHSVKQFLTEFHTSTNIGFTATDADSTMADVIVTYLNYNIFDTRLSTMVVPQFRTGLAPSKIIRSTLSGSVRGLALKLLKSKRVLDYDVCQSLAEAGQFFDTGSDDDFHFFSYAKLFWQYHVFRTVQLEAASPVIASLLPQLLQKRIVDVNTIGAVDQMVLLQAIDNGHESMVELLLDTGTVEVNSMDESGQTPLSWAAQNGHQAIVKLLLDIGKAEINSKDNYGLTPLWWSVINGYEGIVKLLLDTGKVEINTKDEFDQTPLWWAAMNGHEAIVKLLLDTGTVEVNTKNKFDQTPLLWAARNGYKAVVKLLLDTGKADVNLEDRSGRTALSWAVENRHETIVKLLRQHVN